MPINSAIPLQVRPPQPTNPLADVAQIYQLRLAQQLLPLRIHEAQQQQQESALRLQEMQQAVNDRKALDAAYSGAVTNDPDTGLPTFDRAKLSDALIKAGQGHQIPVLLKTLDDSAEAHTKLQQAQADLQQIHVENGAAIGAGAAATGYDPAFFRNRLAIGVANGSLDPKNAQPIIQQLDQATQQDPTGNAAKAIVQKYSQSLMDQSEKMRNALGSQQRGAAATKQADIAGQREGRASAEQGYTDAVNALATNPPKDAEAYQQAVDALPHGIASRILQAVPVNQYDPSKAADAFNKAGMTANERFKADNPTQAGGDDFEKFFAQWRKDHKAPDSAAARLFAKKEWTAAGRDQTTAAGTWQLQEDSKGNTVEYNTKTGQVRAAPDVRRAGTAAKEEAAQEKLVGPARDALAYAQNYVANKVFTGPGDEALQEKFFELAKPSTGFRMTKQQMDMLQNSRGWMQGATALARHAITGTWFSDSQRKQIADTMAELAAAKMKAQGGQGGGAPAPADPLGIR